MGLGEQFDGVLESARMGEEWALTVLYRDLHPRLLRYLLGVTSSALLPFAFASFTMRKAYWRAGAVLTYVSCR